MSDLVNVTLDLGLTRSPRHIQLAGGAGDLGTAEYVEALIAMRDHIRGTINVVSALPVRCYLELERGDAAMLRAAWSVHPDRLDRFVTELRERVAKIHANYPTVLWFANPTIKHDHHDLNF